MRGDILVKQVAAMETKDPFQEGIDASTSPRANRRSRLDRIQRGDITSFIDLRKSSEKDDIDSTTAPQDVSSAEEDQTECKSCTELAGNITINIEASTPVCKETQSPWSFQSKVDLPSNANLTSKTERVSETHSTLATRITIEPAVPEQNGIEFAVRRRANTGPLCSVASIHRESSASETSSPCSTPNGSPRARRRTFDITSTQAYKQLYANNLRSYGMILYKDTNKMCDHTDAHKTQLRNRRRKKQNTLFSSSRQFRRHTGIPILSDTREVHSADEGAVSSEDEGKGRSRSFNLPRRVTDLGAYSLEKVEKKPKEENEAMKKRRFEAEKKRQLRSERMDSLDEMVKQVDNFLKQRKKFISKSTSDLHKVEKNDKVTPILDY